MFGIHFWRGEGSLPCQSLCPPRPQRSRSHIPYLLIYQELLFKWGYPQIKAPSLACLPLASPFFRPGLEPWRVFVPSIARASQLEGQIKFLVHVFDVEFRSPLRVRICWDEGQVIVNAVPLGQDVDAVQIAQPWYLVRLVMTLMPISPRWGLMLSYSGDTCALRMRHSLQGRR